MLNVRQAVNRIVVEDADYKHSQTVVVSERAHAKLRVLAEFMDRTKSGLASELLTAAIDDAIEHLSETPIRGGGVLQDGSPITVGYLIQMRAEQLYQEFIDQQEDRDRVVDDAYAQNVKAARRVKA